MPRARDPDRLDQLARHAIEVFIRHGYRRTQVGDIADAMGVAKGTIYLYVESKEALFDLAIRASTGQALPSDTLPLPTPDPSATVRFVQTHLEQGAAFPRLDAALEGECGTDARAELAEIVRELYQVMSTHRVSIKLIDRSAAQYPDLAATYFGMARIAVPNLLKRFLDARLPPRDTLPTDVLARGIVEVIAFWAIHRHWDPAPTPVDECAAEEAAVRFALGALGDS